MSAPRRVRITSPQTRIALARRHRPAQHLLPPTIQGPDDRDTTEAVRALFADQRRQAARTLALLGAVLFGLSGLLAAAPALSRVTLVGVPLSWLLLMGGSYPVLLAIAVRHVRRAERLERASAPGTGTGTERAP
ncbi:putative solute:sodium symporter small subunit [Streptomyces zhaozhouensis]|uniref:Putative solute:sodium symporter small subunit n=1 Tax=Streptomyces zhaozhouensis TaxID=1300267 RepID=A0A286DT67_9ACTN|nr:hypothetical protein [Streptomyces zhaozhouensis]SOD61887.1 putative solute:sodium symporter small subunit [Streptomyces zhaozhouensis]